MKPCWCKFFLAVAIIILVWVNISWAKIGITAVAAIIAIMSLWGGCCCKDKCECETGKNNK